MANFLYVTLSQAKIGGLPAGEEKARDGHAPRGAKRRKGKKREEVVC
jgi:hypothetical protein